MSGKGSVRWTVGSYADAYDLAAFLRTAEAAVKEAGDKATDTFVRVALRRQEFRLMHAANSLLDAITASYVSKAKRRKKVQR